MRTHIILALTALIVTACASKRDIASTNNDQYTDQTQHAQMIDGNASRIR